MGIVTIKIAIFGISPAFFSVILLGPKFAVSHQTLIFLSVQPFGDLPNRKY
ncbi:hypothetical protein L873DRAFT_669092 [Choiromyces venosus 120613-1]|uniref:Uncharacterized protein n=1 Tax=Choiromyces venosus 120613-1 TaxID=1336337 RepID=A0A3N4JSV3_9PEZI|nr:hypothetical protein L873DRAFT_669092 [Choiromyces venosus 120613-1]